MKPIYTRIFIITVIALFIPDFIMAAMCGQFTSCIGLDKEHAVKTLENNLTIAEIPFLLKKDPPYTYFIWLKENDALVEILMKKSYKKGKLGVANLYLDIGRYEKGIALLKQEVGKGNTDAYIMLAMEYRRGRAIKKNYKKAFDLYQKAKLKGNLDGYFYLGRCYEMGIGVEKDCNKAVENFKEAAEKGHKLAIYRLIEYYKVGACGVPKDLKKVEFLELKLRGFYPR